MRSTGNHLKETTDKERRAGCAPRLTTSVWAFRREAKRGQGKRRDGIAMIRRTGARAPSMAAIEPRPAAVHEKIRFRPESP